MVPIVALHVSLNCYGLGAFASRVAEEEIR
jgi:hypothetical protein